MAARPRAEAQRQGRDDAGLEARGPARPDRTPAVRRIAQQRPWARIAPRHHLEQALSDAREHVHVLVPVDMVGREPQVHLEGVELALDLLADLGRMEETR